MAVDRIRLGERPLDLRSEGGVKAVDVQAQDAQAIRVEGRLAAGRVEIEELLGAEPAEEEVDQRGAVGIGGVLVTVIPVRAGELAQREPVASLPVLLKALACSTGSLPMLA